MSEFCIWECVVAALFPIMVGLADGSMDVVGIGFGWIFCACRNLRVNQRRCEMIKNVKIHTSVSLLERFVDLYGEVPLEGSMIDPDLQPLLQLWHDYYEWTGDHMILTDEGWEPGEAKQSYVDAGDADAILDELNAPKEDGPSDERPYPGKPSPRELMNMGFDIGAAHSREVVDKLKGKMDDASKTILKKLEAKIHELQEAQGAGEK